MFKIKLLNKNELSPYSHILPVPPKLIQTDESDSEHNKPTVIVNDTKVITCPVAEDVDPPPIILWYKDEQLIEYLGPDARVVISNDGRELVIKRAVVDDTARYRCIASNTAGEIEKHFDLDVLGKLYHYVYLLCICNLFCEPFIKRIFLLKRLGCCVTH